MYLHTARLIVVSELIIGNLNFTAKLSLVSLVNSPYIFAGKQISVEDRRRDYVYLYQSSEFSYID